MTAAELEGVESALGVTLPGPYRAAMLAYPLGPADATSRIALQDDPQGVIAFNRFLREQFPGDWRPGDLAVGNSPCGDPYFLDTGGGSADVWAWDHETHEVTREAADFGTWLTVLRSRDVVPPAGLPPQQRHRNM